MTHPFTEHISQKLWGIAASAGLAALLAYFLYSCIHLPVIESAEAGITYSLVFSLSAYFYWYIKEFLKATGAKAAVALIIQGAALAGVLAVLSVRGEEVLELFYVSIPMIVIIGLLCWLSLSLWYSNISCKEMADVTESELTSVNENGENSSGKNVFIDHISVKDGSRLHIVRIEELQFIQAYGDYVMLHTEEGKYVKEQTMKYFEYNLPATFIRIHRSCIVNSSKILRAELYGKESYNIYLKNGVSLRASSAGYKLLKERLSL